MTRHLIRDLFSNWPAATVADASSDGSGLVIDLWSCDLCGSLVHDKAQHTTWHNEVDTLNGEDA